MKKSPPDREKYELARRRTEEVAWGGLFTALCWLFLMAAVWLPTMSLSLRILAAFALLAAELRLGQRGALLIYLSTTLLTLFYPGILLNLPWTLYFAPYLLLAFFFSRFLSGTTGILLRLAAGTGLFSALAGFYGPTLFPASLRARLQPNFWLIVIALGLLGSAVYDALLAYLSVLYRSRLAQSTKPEQ